jgi:hypothetical protein
MPSNGRVRPLIAGHQQAGGPQWCDATSAENTTTDRRSEMTMKRAWDELSAAGHELSNYAVTITDIRATIAGVLPRFELPQGAAEEAVFDLLTGVLDATGDP